MSATLTIIPWLLSLAIFKSGESKEINVTGEKKKDLDFLKGLQIITKDQEKKNNL